MCRSSPFVLPKKIGPKNRIVQVFFSEESNRFSQFFHIFCFSQHCVFQAKSTDAEHFCVKSVFWLELVSKELNHLAAILHVYAGGLHSKKSSKRAK